MQGIVPEVTEPQRAQPTRDHRPSVSRQRIVDVQRGQCKPSDQRSQQRQAMSLENRRSRSTYEPE